MSSVTLSTNPKRWEPGFGTAITTQQTAPALQAADPKATAGVHICQDMNLVKLAFYGSLSSGATTDKTMVGIEIYGWNPVGSTSNDLWAPLLMGRFDAVAGTSVGVAGKRIVNTEHFADTITLIDGDESARIVSGIDNRIASVTLDLEGATRFQVVYTGGFGAAEVDNFNYMFAML